MSIFSAVIRPPAWSEQALCAQIDGDTFYPDNGSERLDIKRVCQGCPVRVQCLDMAMENNEEHGVWGGLTVRERRKLAHSLKAVA